MQVLDDGRTVRIKGKYSDEELEIDLSVLQLAKVFQCDKEVLKELEISGFGSEKLEDKCVEIKEVIKKFPNVEIGDFEINAGSVSEINERDRYSGKNYQGVWLVAEDICGWFNEGIRIRFPERLFEQELKGKAFDLILKQDSIELRPK